MELSELVNFESGRTFDSLISLETVVYIIAIFNVIGHVFGLMMSVFISLAALNGEVTCWRSGFRGGYGECMELDQGNGLFVGIAGTVYSVPMIYLNVGLYQAMQQKDEKGIMFWFQVTSVVTIVRSGFYLSIGTPGSIIEEIIQLWIVHSYINSLEIRKLKTIIGTPSTGIPSTTPATIQAPTIATPTNITNTTNNNTK